MLVWNAASPTLGAGRPDLHVDVVLMPGTQILARVVDVVRVDYESPAVADVFWRPSV